MGAQIEPDETEIAWIMVPGLLLTYLSGATTALRSWPAIGVSETAHGLAPLSASPQVCLHGTSQTSPSG